MTRSRVVIDQQMFDVVAFNDDADVVVIINEDVEHGHVRREQRCSDVSNASGAFVVGRHDAINSTRWRRRA